MMKSMLALMFTLALGLSARAQNDEKGVIARSQEIGQAFDAHDADRFAAYFSETADFLSPMGQLLHGRAAIRDAHAGLFKLWASQKPDKVAHEINGQQVRFLSPDLALLTMTQKTTVTMGGKDDVDTTSFVVLFRRADGQWLVESAALTPVQPMGGPKK
jgi:uncharacterized protein (TIGR02246 family)